jgi:N-hydroxyarylamine O-acetyltransferase
MQAELDIDAYFTRIGLKGKFQDKNVSDSLATLVALHRAHVQCIPFENLDPFLGRPVQLDIASLQRKLIHGGPGGWCFEQNLLFGAVLRKLGFDVTGLGARVLWNAPENHIGPRSHMLLLVKLDGERHIADVGFGGQTLTEPLRLEPGIEQDSWHDKFRLLAVGDDFVLQGLIGEDWKPLYRFDLQPQLQADYEVTNWYLSNHPDSHFVTGLSAALPAYRRRYALRNNQFSIHRLNGGTEHKTLHTAAELRETLEKIFLITLPDTPGLDQALTRLIAASQ